MPIITIKEIIGFVFVAALVIFTVIVCAIGSKEKEPEEE